MKSLFLGYSFMFILLLILGGHKLNADKNLRDFIGTKVQFHRDESPEHRDESPEHRDESPEHRDKVGGSI
jgi:hypothetical protein